MIINSLGLKTDLLFNRFAGKVIDRGDYIVVRTDSRPQYFWGNYLIMNHPPDDGDFHKWIDLFESEIGSREQRGFMAITWDSVTGEQGRLEKFFEAGFSINKSIILTAEKVLQPPKFNPDVEIRSFTTDEDWNSYLDIHFSDDWGYGNEESQNQFLTKERDNLRLMVNRGYGMRFLADYHGVPVGDVGVYWEGDIGRFSNVGTHRHYQRRGVCSTMIYTTSRFMLEQKGIKTLVMEADAEYHAARIYQTVGFNQTELRFSLQWYDKKVFNRLS